MKTLTINKANTNIVLLNIMNIQKKCQIILDNIPDIAWLVDTAGIIQVVNKVFLKTYRLSQSEVIGKSYHDLLDTKTADRYLKQDQQVINSQKQMVFETNYEQYNENWLETRWLEITLIPGYADEFQNQCIGVVGFGHDITARKQQAIALQEQQEKLKIYFELPLIGMAVISADKYWLDINQKLCDMLGYEHHELMQTNFLELISEDYKVSVTDFLKLLTENKLDSLDLDVEMFHQNGTKLFTRLIVRCQQNTPKSAPSYVIMIEDTTVRKKAEQKLHLANKVIESSSEAILITDHANKIIRVNPAFSQLTGYQEDEVLGQTPKLLNSGRHSKKFYQALWRNLLEKGHWQGEIWDRRKDGNTYPKWMNISTISDSEEDGVGKYVALFSDITEQKRAENKIRYMVYHDTLTGLANRSLFEERLTRAINDAELDHNEVAVMLMDLDHFKKINDSMGHYIGDQLLIEVSKRLKKVFRNTDLISRFGGDEFVIMLDKVSDREHIKALARKLLDAFEHPLNVLEYTMHITPSIGITLFPNDGVNHQTLLQNVDTAMFSSKKGGRNQYTFFASDMNIAAQQRLKLEYRMRLSIEKKDFKLFYQPQVNLQENKITGVEALIRWPYKDMMISPAEFIPVAEDTGLIGVLGKWIMEQACLDCKSWHEQGFPITVAVNLSAQQFETDYLTGSIKNALSNSNLSGKFLDLEITESTLMHNSNNAIKLLNSLKKMGIKLSIDDFGTGYSSLAYLKAFNIDKLKIDQSFVFNLPDDKDDAAITTAIIQLAKSLNLKIVAEGAETIENVEFLREQGCDQIQGYYYAKPMPAHELILFMKEWC